MAIAFVDGAMHEVAMLELCVGGCFRLSPGTRVWAMRQLLVQR